jgi:hypothetical protein
MDALNVYTSAGGDCMDNISPYVRGGRFRCCPGLSYIEEVVGSSPIPPTEEIPRDGEYVFIISGRKGVKRDFIRRKIINYVIIFPTHIRLIIKRRGTNVDMGGGWWLWDIYWVRMGVWNMKETIHEKSTNSETVNTLQVHELGNELDFL